MTIKTFQEILAWQKSHELTLLTYKFTENYPRSEMFGLVSQSRRCAVSIPPNIAEGFKRRTKNDSIHFYNIAEGSLEELKYQILLARDLSLIKASEYETFLVLAEEVGRLIHGWIKIQK
jgi:four helix bundle protein